jgi:hypothetical protein
MTLSVQMLHDPVVSADGNANGSLKTAGKSARIEWYCDCDEGSRRTLP